MSLASILTNWFSSELEIQKDPKPTTLFDDDTKTQTESVNTNIMAPKTLEDIRRPPYLHCMIAGGLGGTTGDLLMHSLDTVKTRQQGDPHIPPKYSSMSSSYALILRQEGIRRGLYGGWLPAFLGSFPGTMIFFGTYECSKRNMIEHNFSPQLSYLVSGLFADFAASFVYVPSEVLKTRLQLQGRYNNPFFNSGYNYRSTLHAARSIIRQEGVSALFYGYKATLIRDLPFSALQFFFYEQGRTWASRIKQSREIGLPLELLTGAVSGGLAGVITCPLDVVKTRMQTQISSELETKLSKSSDYLPSNRVTNIDSSLKQNHRPLSTSLSHSARAVSINLSTSSVISGLKTIYKSEALPGLFRGAGPRIVWTGVQSCCMLFLYQKILQQLELYTNVQCQDSDIM